MTRSYDDPPPISYTRAELVFFGIAAVLILAWAVVALFLLAASLRGGGPLSTIFPQAQTCISVGATRHFHSASTGRAQAHPHFTY